MGEGVGRNTEGGAQKDWTERMWNCSSDHFAELKELIVTAGDCGSLNCLGTHREG